MVCIPRIRFFFIVISLPPKLSVVRESGTHPVQKLTVSFHAIAHLFLGHIFVHCKSLFLIYLYLTPAGGRLCSWSEAIRENQSVTVLLHRIDEELLHILHSNTSIKHCSETPHLKVYISILAALSFVCCTRDGRIITLYPKGKKWDNWLLIGRYWLLWIKYESFPHQFIDTLWIIYGYPKLLPKTYLG